jgi:hypothetical protein
LEKDILKNYVQKIILKKIKNLKFQNRTRI